MSLLNIKMQVQENSVFLYTIFLFKFRHCQCNASNPLSRYIYERYTKTPLWENKVLFARDFSVIS